MMLAGMSLLWQTGGDKHLQLGLRSCTDISSLAEPSKNQHKFIKALLHLNGVYLHTAPPNIKPVKATRQSQNEVVSLIGEVGRQLRVCVCRVRNAVCSWRQLLAWAAAARGGLCQGGSLGDHRHWNHLDRTGGSPQEEMRIGTAKNVEKEKDEGERREKHIR